MARWLGALTSVALAGVLAVPAIAGITVYEEGDKKLEIGGRIQMQYRTYDPDTGESYDDLFFRRLRPYIAGTVTKDWYGKIQFDFGKAEGDNEMQLKDAYAQYRGLKNLKISFGNTKTPFSREFLASSKEQQLVERSFVGDHNFGSPDRQLGVKLEGHNESKKVTWSAAFGSESHDPSASKLDFDSPANRDDDWNEGWVAAGRVDFHPRGYVEFGQADFHSDEWRYNFSVAGFSWTNDDDNNTYTDPNNMTTDPGKVDLDSSHGLELSAGLRGRGLSADVEYQMIHAEIIDSMFTGGIYRDGETDLDKLAVEVGYMLDAAPVEFVGGWETLDSDNYDKAVERKSIGVNWYWNKHKAKWQNTFRVSDNVDGVDGESLKEFYSQLQFVF